jgi:hypothetical protein
MLIFLLSTFSSDGEHKYSQWIHRVENVIVLDTFLSFKLDKDLGLAPNTLINISMAGASWG